MPDDRVTLAGSQRAEPIGVVVRGDAPADDRVDVTIVVRSRAIPPSPVTPESAAITMSREAFAQQYGAAPEDLAAVEAFARSAGLEVVASDAARRSVMVRGTVGAMNAAFGTQLRAAQCDGLAVRVRTGPLMIPSSLDGIIVGVHGLDSRPQASAHFRALRPSAAAAASFTPPQLAALYDFPAAANGAGQTIALIELGGGYATTDLDTYFRGLGIAPPSVTAVGVDGAANAPSGDPNSADGEVLLDIEVAGALAPAAKIVVYFAPNTDAGFLDAITTAIHDTTHAPTIVSISWGGAESTWTQQSLTNYDAALADAATLGVTVTVAAGDNGSSDGISDGKSHVDFPASSPHVLACGGTSLHASGTTIGTETVWNDGSSGGATGGGISDAFALPAWQSRAHVPPSANAGARVGRGLPDVAGDADPQTGYAVVVDGQSSVFGGTSAVAPLWAGLIARLNQLRGKPLGFINPALYANPAALRDIVSGNNGAYAAGAGWDACTGLGSPNGAALATALNG